MEERDLEYERINTINDEIKCKNYEICDTTIPVYWFERMGRYTCVGCHMMFGTWGMHLGKGEHGVLIFMNDLECPICLDTKRCVSQPRCEHYACVDCFKRCYYGAEREYPDFPYPEIEDNYYDDIDVWRQNNPNWKIDYPLIEKYEQESDIIDDQFNSQYSNEKHLRICPLCRK